MNRAKVAAASAVAEFWFEKALDYENSGRITLAIACGKEADKAFQTLLELDSSESAKERAKDMLSLLQTESEGNELDPSDNSEFSGLCVEQAMAYDKADMKAQAKDLYLRSAHAYLSLHKNPSTTASDKDNYFKRAQLMISRIESLEKPPPPAQARQVPVAQSSSNPALLSSVNKQDLIVLRSSAKINGQMFHPFDENEARFEKYQFAQPWTDPMPKLKMSESQRKHFGGWIRASQFFSSEQGGKGRSKAPPNLISMVSPVHIVQENVTDCSFVSSLCVAANYERRVRKQLISGLIYPKDKNGIPAYNPSGKYLVKLWFNGIARKVLVDDYLPLGKNGSLLCSFSSLKNELWVSIIEKAYMKVNGGYDFPGSNSGIDLYSLTGWIPQAHHMKNIKSIDDKLKTWGEIFQGHNRGNLLLTCSTPAMERDQEKHFGLVSSHAYAILNLVEVDVGGFKHRMLQIKNPWGSKSWKGELDPAVFDAVKTKLNMQGMNDEASRKKGIFWVEFDTLIKYFEAIYCNWDPRSFSNSLAVHRHWQSQGPANDSIILAHNPQFKLAVQVERKVSLGGKQRFFAQGVVWILLSRHVAQKAQILSHDKKDFLTIHVYDRRNGELVLYPGKSLISGVYSNNPHVLCRLNIPCESGPVTRNYTLVVSAYEKSNAANTGLSYSLTVYSTANCSPKPSLYQIPNRYTHFQTIRSRWSLGDGKELLNSVFTAGGSINDLRTYKENPMFKFVLYLSSNIRIRLLTHKEQACNVAIFGCADRQVLSKKKMVESSGDYRAGFCYLEVSGLTEGTYVIVPSAFDRGSPGEIVLEIESFAKFSVDNLG
eukprot:maker-scaffold_1-snap-gene-27.49-mRNA-1 protein AED:0.01 eAED:0.02 QI:313/1/0.66/1/1/1/3/0/825